MRRARSAALVLALSLAAAVAGPAARLAAQADESEPLLRAEFRVELQPVSPFGDPDPLELEAAARLLLDEATWVYAGMVWGFRYEYEPYDRTRGIAERFVLSPLGAIPKGDPRLVPGAARRAGGELAAYVEYRPLPVEAALLGSYAKEPWERSQAEGAAKLSRGWAGRREALEDALREAVRAHLRSIEPNKPRRSTGRVVLERPPRIVVREGSYLAQVRARVDVQELAPYVVY